MTIEMQEYIQTLKQCIIQCQAMLEQEKQKRKALLGRDMSVLESVISDQQANIMQLDNMEGQRMLAQEAAGFGQLTAKEMLQAMSAGELRESIEPLQEQLRDIVLQIQRLNQEAMKIAQNELRILEQFGITERKDMKNPTYGKPGQHKKAEWSSFEQKI